MKPPQEVLADYLARQNLKMTAQRRLILDVFLREKNHLSAEELYAKIKTQDPSVGQATVYRTLKLLTEARLAEEVNFADGVLRYEPLYGIEHHDHLICEGCGKNIEIMDPVIERRQEELARKHGFVLSRHKMNLYGLCEKCRKKNKAPKKTTPG
ncbi:MAG: transcriptional repressor [Desulfovibrionaceae bacterium]|nr:transcriptional repressor [Desulfovibrionaceae bacterium]